MSTTASIIIIAGGGVAAGALLSGAFTDLARRLNARRAREIRFREKVDVLWADVNGDYNRSTYSKSLKARLGECESALYKIGQAVNPEAKRF
tara:strand:+ start:703 stop:978 length:276 start_codon:yes stop_codon:yes gene_type:complete